MSKKFLMILISIILIVLIVLFTINNKNSKKLKENNETVSGNDSPKVESNYDENTSLYYVRDEKTGEIIGASQDETDLEFYKENPDYNPNPLQQRSTDIEDYYYSEYTNESY